MKKQIVTLTVIVLTWVTGLQLMAQCSGGGSCPTPIPWYTLGNTIGTGCNIFGTLDNNDILIYGDNTQVGQITGDHVSGNKGNFGIGIAGTSPNNKLLVENGTISTATTTCGAPAVGPYAALCGLPVVPSDIGIYSYSNNTASGTNNIGVASVVDASQPIQAGFVAIIKNGSAVNAGMFINLLSNTAGVGNNGISGNITGNNDNNNGVQISITDANSSANSTGYESDIAGNTATNNTNFQGNINGASVTGYNTGYNSFINADNANINTILNGSISASNAYQNVGGNITINGNGATYENEGLILVINGTNSVNYGISGNIAGSGTPQQWGVSMNVAGTVNNTGVAGYVGNTSETNSINIGVLGNSTGGAGCTNSGFSGSINGSSSCYNTGTYTWIAGDNNNNWGILGQPGPPSANIGGFYGLSGANSTDIGVEAQIIDGGGSPDANSSIYGVIGSSAAQTCLSQVGVWGYLANNAANCTGGYQYAVMGTAPISGTPVPGGLSSGGNGTCPPTYAGYFEGDVFCSNTYYYSDPKLKSNISDYTGALAILDKIPVKQYDFNTSQYPYMNLPLGHQVGVLSTDMKQLLPNLVKPAYHPGAQKGDQGVSFDAVNYNSLIPIMIQAIQEVDAKTNPANTTASTQQAQIDALTRQLNEQNKQIASLTTMLNDICNLGCAGLQNSNGNNQDVVLYQSIPNPTSGAATIGYIVNIPFKDAVISVSSTTGSIMKEFKITQNGKGSIVFDGSQYEGATFRYSLIIDNRLYDTKTIVMTKE
jgi:hypothetical protein